MVAWLSIVFFAAVACMGCGALFMFDPVGAYVSAVALAGIIAAVATARRKRS